MVFKELIQDTNYVRISNPFLDFGVMDNLVSLCELLEEIKWNHCYSEPGGTTTQGTLPV